MIKIVETESGLELQYEDWVVQLKERVRELVAENAGLQQQLITYTDELAQWAQRWEMLYDVARDALSGWVNGEDIVGPMQRLKRFLVTTPYRQLEAPVEEGREKRNPFTCEKHGLGINPFTGECVQCEGDEG